VDVAQLIETCWGHSVRQIEPLTDAMNSETWSVETDAGRFALKSVGVNDRGFIHGLELAASLDSHGVTTGAPVTTVDGHLFQQVDDRSVALLRWVDGEPLTAVEPRSASRIGAMLARVHEAGATKPGTLETWLRVLPFWGDHLDFQDWIRPAVDYTLEDITAHQAAASLTWAGLHGDPSPSAFLIRGDDTALIDWGATMHGPALYDLASAAMYLGCSIEDAGPESVRRAVSLRVNGAEHSRSQALINAYLAARPSLADEVCLGFALYLRLRWCVQAGYFAWRCANDVRTGIRSADENNKGLLHAQTGLSIPS
jgi:homoserine kinase type II